MKPRKKLKKINNIFFILLFILIILLSSHVFAKVITIGDVNLDGKRDINDTIKALRHMASQSITGKEEWKLNDEQIYQADINNNGKIELNDIISIQRYIAAKTIPEMGEKHQEWITKLEKEMPISPESITLDKVELTLKVNDNPNEKQYKLIYTILPANCDKDMEVTWNSSDSSIATVSNDGLVTAVKAGNATITATTANGKKATCQVKVEEPEKISLNKADLVIDKSITTKETLIATVISQNKTVTWESSNANVATVDQNGNITPLANGETTITAKLASGVKAECKVKVETSIKSISLDKSNITIDLNSEQKTAKLQINTEPEDANKDISFIVKSSNQEIATAELSSKEVTITAVAKGKSNITVETKNGKTATCNVEVIDTKCLKEIEITNLTLGKLPKGAIGKITAKIACEASDCKQHESPITLESNNNNIVEILETKQINNNPHEVTAYIKTINSGTAKINAICGETTASIDIDVCTCLIEMKDVYSNLKHQPSEYASIKYNLRR